MPTPVSAARHCLASEASSALDDAVSVARRRQHAQTTSLHVIFALLSSSSSSSTSSSPSPLLRDALTRARSSAYSPRLQFKALELCFGVALDRLPSSASSSSASASASADDEPPVSNSLMAAIKRSQANQRRHPDTFHFYQQQQQMNSTSSSSSSFSGVKVELQQLILAILDDPVVSRVFGEAGFRSTDIKMALLRPPPPILRFPRAARCPPLFLCNFPAGDELEAVNLTPRGFSFPFSDSGDENCRRIADIMAREKNRNPMLVGVGAGDAARDFVRALDRKNPGVLPAEMSNLRFVSVEREVVGMRESKDSSWIEKRLDELGEGAKEGAGVVVGIGDLKELVDLGDDLVNCLVSEISRVLEACRERLWVMGWSATYETYMKFLSRYPMLDKDWDLQLQLITSARSSMGGLTARPPSLMESFVPFGGFFPTAYESNIPVMKPISSIPPQCQHCTDMYEQELAIILKECTPLCADQHQTKLPSWLQSVHPLDSTKVKYEEKVLNPRVAELQKKWNDHCQRLHHGFPRPEVDKHQVLPRIIRLPLISEKDRSINHSIIKPCATQSQSGFSSALPMKIGIQKMPTSLPQVPEPINKDLTSKLQSEDRISPQSVSSVTTDLVLATTDLALCSPSKKSNEFTKHHTCERFDLNNFKAFRTSLIEKVRRQDAAVFAISHAIIQCKSGNERRRGASLKGDIWFCFQGPDRFGKRRAATAIAELMFGSQENMICIDLGYQDSVISRNSICEHEISKKHDVSFRGKTVADQIVGEISKKPFSVVFLENVEKADFLVQDGLSQAIRTGKISDSHGREFGISNAIFVVTTNRGSGKLSSSPRKESVDFCEENILAAQRWQMKLSIESISEAAGKRPNFNVSITSRKESENKQVGNKRKLDTFLDLNLPLEEVEDNDADCSSSSNNSGSEEPWMDEFLQNMDGNINFEPFDFDALADHVLKEIRKRLCSVIGSECLMEIDVKAMEQILAAAWLLEDIKSLNNWLENVLLKSFIELRRRYGNKLSSCTILKLSSMEDTFTNELAPGVLLPSRIIVD